MGWDLPLSCEHVFGDLFLVITCNHMDTSHWQPCSPFPSPYLRLTCQHSQVRRHICKKVFTSQNLFLPLSELSWLFSH